jgi:hypothetical protein
MTKSDPAAFQKRQLGRRDRPSKTLAIATETPGGLRFSKPNSKSKLIAGTHSDPAMRMSIQLGVGFQIAYTVLESGRTSAEIDCRIPIAAVGHRDLSRRPFIMPAMIVVRPAALETLKVCVAHHSHIALMRALNDNNVASVEIFTVVDETHYRLL